MTYIQAALKRDGDSLSPPLLGIHTLFLGPEFPLTWRNSGESHLFLLPAWLALSLWLGEGVVELVHGTAFSLQLAPNAILEQCSCCGTARRGDAMVHLEQNICPFG